MLPIITIVPIIEMTLKDAGHGEGNLILVDGMTWRHKSGDGPHLALSHLCEHHKTSPDL